MSLRTPITLLVLLGLVMGAGWYGWREFQEPFDNPFATGSDACVQQTVPAGERLHRNQVLVNVYNAGSRDGLATTTLEQLVTAGFLRGVASNAPRELKVRKVTVVDSRPTSAAVRLVRDQFRGRVKVATRPDLRDAGVDVFVGNAYSGLRPKAAHVITVRGDQEVCVPPATSSDDDS